jgi:hypothetical protein
MEFWPLKTLSKVSGVLLGLQLSPTPNMGVHLGVWGSTPSHSLHSLHSRGHVIWLSGLLLGPQPLNFLALAASQMLGLRHISIYLLSTIRTLGKSPWSNTQLNCYRTPSQSRLSKGGGIQNTQRWWRKNLTSCWKQGSLDLWRQFNGFLLWYWRWRKIASWGYASTTKL